MYANIIKNKSLPNILVFGGTGYLGGNLVNRMINKYALNEQYNIIVLSSKKKELQYETIYKNVYLYNGIDVFNPETYKDILPHGAKNQKCKYIIHSIGIFNTNLAYKNLINNKSLCKIPYALSSYICSMSNDIFKNQTQKSQLETAKEFYKWNFQSMENIAKNVSNSKTKLIYISAKNSPLATKEYIASKRLSEKLILEKSEQKLLDGVIFRPGVIYDNRLKQLSVFELLKLMFTMENKISLRDLINYLISNGFAFNKNLYFTNMDNLNDKICETIIETENCHISNKKRIISNSNI